MLSSSRQHHAPCCFDHPQAATSPPPLSGRAPVATAICCARWQKAPRLLNRDRHAARHMPTKAAPRPTRCKRIMPLLYRSAQCSQRVRPGGTGSTGHGRPSPSPGSSPPASTCSQPLSSSPGSSSWLCSASNRVCRLVTSASLAASCCRSLPRSVLCCRRHGLHAKHGCGDPEVIAQAAVRHVLPPHAAHRTAGGVLPGWGGRCAERPHCAPHPLSRPRVLAAHARCSQDARMPTCSSSRLMRSLFTLS